MDLFNMFKIFLDLIILFVLGFSFGTEKLKFKRYCYIILGIVSVVLTILSMIEYHFITSLIYGLISLCWFTLSIVCKNYEDKFLK